MEQLKVNKFLVIKDATFDVGKINLIIGPQANGKSILAKLLYFFREVINNTFIVSIKNNDDKRQLTKSIGDLFEKYFPKYTWKDTQFSLNYITKEFDITISKNKTTRTIHIELCELLLQLHRSLKKPTE